MPGNHLSVCGCFLLGNDRGEEDNGYAFKTPVGPDLRGQVAAVDLRHHDIEKDEVGLETARRLQGAVGVVLRANRVSAGALQVQLHRAGDARFVVDDEDSWLLSIFEL